MPSTQRSDERPLDNPQREAGVLHSEKMGKEVWYDRDPDAVRAALPDALDFLDVQ